MKLKYFNPYDKGYSTKYLNQKGYVDLHTSEKLNFGQYTLWLHILQQNGYDVANKEHLTINILIPFHNSNLLEKLLKNLKFIQKLPKEIHIVITIVASACHPEYVAHIYNLQEQLSSNLFTIQILLEDLPGKPRALNTGISHIKSRYIISLVDDINLQENAIALLWLSILCCSEYGASVLVGIPSYLSGSTLLDKVQKIHHELFYTNDQYALVGRAFAFDKNIVLSQGGFPEHIMSEDFWLEMQVRNSTAGFIVVDHTYIEYYKPATWYDYLAQIDRFDGSFRQLHREFPELFAKYYGDIHNSFMSMLGAKSFMDIIRFMKSTKYNPTAKATYIMIVIYQLYILRVKNIFFPVESSAFKREASTLG